MWKWWEVLVLIESNNMKRISLINEWGVNEKQADKQEETHKINKKKGKIIQKQ